MGWIDRAIGLTLPVIPKPVVRFFSRHYIAGATTDEALDTVRYLAGQGAMSTLDVLGEFATNLDEAEANTQEYLRLIARIASEGLKEANVSVKLSALGLLLDPARCLENMRRLTRPLEANDSFVRIDMEDSSCTDATLKIYRALRDEFGDRRVGVVLQSRLHRSLSDTVALAHPGANFRLCKGIYVEPESIGLRDNQAIRDNFVEILDRMFAGGAYVGIATHDAWLVERARALVAKHRLTRGHYEFQMLLGVLAPLRRRLIAEGHRLRVYVPYGQNWYAYSVRRLRENPQIAWHVFKALARRR